MLDSQSGVFNMIRLVSKADDVLLGATCHRLCVFMLSNSTVLELQQILFEEFGFTCDKKTADEIAVSLVAFTETLIEINNESLCKNVITE